MNITPVRGIEVFGNEIPTPGGMSVWTREEGYLARHALRSHWFAEPTNALPARAFAALLTRLPGMPQKELRTAFYVQIYVGGTHGESPRITQDNAGGFAVYSREANGVMCRYFRRIPGDPAYQHVEKLDSIGSSMVSSEEMTLLHFASFDRAPDDSGIYSFVKDLTKQEKTSLKSLSKKPLRANLDDGVSGDGSLNRGVIFLQDDPVPDGTCGLPCTGPGGLGMYCAFEPFSGMRYCKTAIFDCGGDKLALALANRAPSGRIPPAAVALQTNLNSFRVLRDAVLGQSPVGVKYVGYYRLFSRYATFAPPILAKYAAALPHIYKAVSVLLHSGRGEEIVITPALYAKAISILDALSKTRNKHVKSMLEDVRQDLLASRGLTRAQLVDYMNHQTPSGGESKQDGG